MIFPLIELKFSNIHRTFDATTLLVRIYRVDDGGVDQAGQQQYARTLKLERTITLPPDITTDTIVAGARLRLTTWAEGLGYTLPPERLICTLS